jgi:hypothetical protein
MKQFSDLLNRLVSEKGQGSLADELRIDGSALSRFRSGQGCAPISVVDHVLDIGNAVIISRQELKRLEDALETVSDLWKAERKKEKHE